MCCLFSQFSQAGTVTNSRHLVLNLYSLFSKQWFCSQELGKQVTHTLKGFFYGKSRQLQPNIDIYIFSGALRLITGGGLPLETSDFLENSNFEAIDISSMINEQHQRFNSNMTINVTSACDLIPPFPNRMWGAVSILGLVSKIILK